MQTVISGRKEDMERAQTLFMEGRMMFFPLNTSGAFHSRYMADARDAFAKFLADFEFSDPVLPVIANATGRPYEAGQVVELLARQITSPVLWTKSMQYVFEQGGEAVACHEVGPGDVLTGMLDKIRRESATQPTVKATPGGEPSPARSVDAAPPPAAATSSADEKVAAWNRAHPIGTKTVSKTLDYGELETRTEAMVLFGHRAAVYMKGYNGYFDLDELATA